MGGYRKPLLLYPSSRPEHRPHNVRQSNMLFSPLKKYPSNHYKKEWSTAAASKLQKVNFLDPLIEVVCLTGFLSFACLHVFFASHTVVSLGCFRSLNRLFRGALPTVKVEKDYGTACVMMFLFSGEGALNGCAGSCWRMGGLNSASHKCPSGGIFI